MSGSVTISPGSTRASGRIWPPLLGQFHLYALALAHVVQNKVEAAYARSDLFERRRLLMDD